MDWLFDAGSTDAAGATEELVAAHLRRRAVESSEAQAAARAASDAVASLEARTGTVWVRFDWERAQPKLRISATDQPVASSDRSVLAPGVWAADEQAEELENVFIGQTVELTLPVTRPPELHVEVHPSQLAEATEIAGFTGAVATTMLHKVELGATGLEAAAAAGASFSEIAAATYAARHAGRTPSTAAEVAEAFVAFHREAGGDFFVVESSERRAVVANRICPFGASVAGRRSVCRSTAALLGSLAAQAAGSAQVVLDEAIAAGDARCRAVIDFDAEPSRWAQRYQRPAAPARPAQPEEAAQGFRIGLSLQLPRDRLSVPLIRHLVSHALREVAVTGEDIADVELAVTEAAANVIDHAGTGDAYEVSVTIGPALAELRVVDIGRGFDHEAIAGGVASPHDEQGRGLTLMNALMDQVRLLSAPERGTVVHLVKQLHFDDTNPVRRLMLAQTDNSIGTDEEPDGSQS